MDTTTIPLNYEASNGNTHIQTTTTLPAEVIQCLENARFLHLATCHANVPHVSLMNYTYLPSSPYAAGPVIVMTTNPASRKMTNLVANARVSLLVHDWVSHRPTTAQRRLSGGSPDREAAASSSLASLLYNLNTSAVSSISATISGTARLVAHGSDEDRFYRERHLENNTFDAEPESVAAMDGRGRGRDDGGRECFVAGEEVRVIVVGIRDVRIADWKGNVRDWVLVAPGQDAMVNGV